MRKYYCDRCRRLYNQFSTCTCCGTVELKEIWIEVQNQSENNN